MITIRNKFNFFQLVYVITDSDQRARMVLQISVTPDGAIVYLLGNDSSKDWYYEEELSETKTFV